jgi:hypothetical protein
MAAPIRLVALASEALRAYPLVKKQTTVGSAPDNDIVIDHKSVSRRHAVLVRRLGHFAVRDLDSTNGTRINGQRTSGTRRVRAGDEVEFGNARFAVMNAPRRRRGLGVPATVAILVALTLAGFGLARYLQIYPQVHSPFPSAPAPENPPPAGATSEHAFVAEARHATAPPQASGGRKWLATLNNYRAMAGLAPLSEDPELSVGDFAHARYVVKNSGSLAKAEAMGAEIHTEEPGKPLYSVEGLRAARAGDIEQWWGPLPSSQPPPAWAIDEWIASTWHRLWLLNPHLREVGYGEYCEHGACAAVLDVLTRLGRTGFVTAGASAPVQFPPQGSSVHLDALTDEWPDPLSSCHGYTLPAGLPITLQLGAMVPARLEAYSLRRDSAPDILEACGFDALSYFNPNGGDQARSRNVLSTLGAVVVMPRAPLAPGNYTVEMTVNGRSYSWRFSIDKDSG